MALKALRSEHKPHPISQDDLALSAGISRSYLGEIESAKHDIGLWTLWRLKAALKVTGARFVREIERHYHPPANNSHSRNA